MRLKFCTYLLGFPVENDAFHIWQLCKNILLRNFRLSRNLRPFIYFEISVFSGTENLTVGKIVDSYTTNRVLSNAQVKSVLSSLLFFSIFFFKPYNASAIHPYIYICRSWLFRCLNFHQNNKWYASFGYRTQDMLTGCPD